jgi:hypothetical protein
VFALTAVVAAQPPAPVAAMFAADQKGDPARATSFEAADLQASKAAPFPARVYLSTGDFERASIATSSGPTRPSFRRTPIS